MAQPLTDLVEQFCNFQRKQRGKTEGGVKTYRWNLEQFLVFIRNRDGRLARVTDLTASTVQAWMDDMAAEDLALSTMRVRQSTVSSFCAWLVKREILTANPVAKLERRHITASRRDRFLARRSWTRSWSREGAPTAA
jgi:integrase/recombinase XerC